MSSERVGCESAREETVHLLPSGEVDICHAKGTSTNPNPCDVGNPGLGVPTITNGTQLTVAPFRCSFTREALTCIVIKLARGFRLNQRGHCHSRRARLLSAQRRLGRCPRPKVIAAKIQAARLKRGSWASNRWATGRG